MKLALSRPGRAGFNLIEIMIVILIIAVIGGIALPALFATLKRAEWSKTRAQMRAIVSAFHTYAAEHNNLMPPAYYPNGEREGRWLDTTIFVYVRNPDEEAAMGQGGGSGGGTGGGSGEEEPGFDAEKGTHLLETVFVCPASVKAFPDEDNYYNHSFLLNRSLIAAPGVQDPEFAPRPITLFQDWASVMLLAEGPEGNNNSIAHGEWTQLEEGMKRYDGRFSHFAYLDGHVEQIRRQDLEEMKQVQAGSSNGDFRIEGWHTAWFGVTPDRYPKTTGGSGPGINVNY
jgi:prepilin-type N-terminal cleavage/methylation domain-containing protein/prepilin-type processing-associated H-X9-DG protein